MTMEDSMQSAYRDVERYRRSLRQLRNAKIALGCCYIAFALLCIMTVCTITYSFDKHRTCGIIITVLTMISLLMSYHQLLSVHKHVRELRDKLLNK